MNKSTNATYDQYVKMGRDLVSQVKCHQAQIAYYATKVCEIKHGGKTRSSVYTLGKYAADIGVNRKTLSEWVSIYRNVIVKIDLDAEKVTQKDWTVATRVQKLFKDEKQTVQAIMGIPHAKNRGVRQDMSPAKVKDLFKQSYNGPNMQSEVYAWNDSIITIKNKIASRDLSGVSLSSLISLKENLDKASEHLLRQITKAKPEKKVKNAKAAQRAATK